MGNQVLKILEFYSWTSPQGLWQRGLPTSIVMSVVVVGKETGSGISGSSRHCSPPATMSFLLGPISGALVAGGVSLLWYQYSLNSYSTRNNQVYYGFSNLMQTRYAYANHSIPISLTFRHWIPYRTEQHIKESVAHSHLIQLMKTELTCCLPSLNLQFTRSQRPARRNTHSSPSTTIRCSPHPTSPPIFGDQVAMEP